MDTYGHILMDKTLPNKWTKYDFKIKKLFYLFCCIIYIINTFITMVSIFETSTI